MKCRRVIRLLPAFMSGETKSSIHNAIVHHLEKCDSCKHEYEMLRADAEILRGVQVPESVELMSPRILADFCQRADFRSTNWSGAQSRPSWSVFGQAAAAVAAGVIVAVGACAGVLLGSAIARSESRMVSEVPIIYGSEPSFVDVYESVLSAETDAFSEVSAMQDGR